VIYPHNVTAKSEPDEDDQSSEDEDIPKLRCTACGQAFEQEFGLKQHLVDAHKKGSTKDTRLVHAQYHSMTQVNVIG